MYSHIHQLLIILTHKGLQLRYPFFLIEQVIIQSPLVLSLQEPKNELINPSLFFIDQLLILNEKYHVHVLVRRVDWLVVDDIPLFLWSKGLFRNSLSLRFLLKRLGGHC